jgi:hypothetical protein
MTSTSYARGSLRSTCCNRFRATAINSPLPLVAPTYIRCMHPALLTIRTSKAIRVGVTGTQRLSAYTSGSSTTRPWSSPPLSCMSYLPSPFINQSLRRSRYTTTGHIFNHGPSRGYEHDEGANECICISINPNTLRRVRSRRRDRCKAGPRIARRVSQVDVDSILGFRVWGLGFRLKV